MNTEQKKTLIDNMTDNLPTLRIKLNLSQEDLGGKIGVSRSTVAAIENKKKRNVLEHISFADFDFHKEQRYRCVTQCFRYLHR